MARLGGVPFSEHCYRLFWWHEGDVFRLLMSLQNVLDGCTWASSDADLARALQSFIRSVTGAHVLSCLCSVVPVACSTARELLILNAVQT